MILRAPRLSKKLQHYIFSAFISDQSAAKTVVASKTFFKRQVFSRNTVNLYFRHYRELIYAATDKAPRFDGEVEIDIGFFGGRASKYTSEELRRIGGMAPGRQVAALKKLKKVQKKALPVFGFLRRHGDIYLLPIKGKSRMQLESAVRLVIARGSIVYSDAEKGLAQISLDGYKHHVINKALGKYSLGDGIHVNGIESFWSELRRSMGKNFRGIPKSTILYHLKEREFRHNHKHDFTEALTALMKKK